MKENNKRGNRMGAPFHQNVPSWIIKYLNYTQCNKCSQKIKKQDIVAIGIRGVDNETTLYIEHKCPNCSHRAMKSFGSHIKGTLEELCYLLLEEGQNKRRIQQAYVNETKKINRTQMTENEIKTFLDNLNKCETYMDLLKEIGALEWLNES
jgi:DNA-directed RNA polymerase subunit RPC12/RpoP